MIYRLLNLEMICWRFMFLLYLSIAIFPAWGGDQVNITGVLVNCCNEPISGAVVTLASCNLSVTSGSDGKFSLQGPTGVHHDLRTRKQIPVHFGSVEVFDIQGRQLFSIEESKDLSRRIRLSSTTMSQAVYLAKYTQERGGTQIAKVIGGLGAVRSMPYTSVSPSITTVATASVDSLHITAPYYSKTVAVDGYTQNIGTVSIARQGDEFNDCGRIAAWSDSVARKGIVQVSDSLIKSPAAFEWSTKAFKIAMPSPSTAYCLIDVLPWGFFSECKSTGTSGLFSTCITGFFTMPAPKSMNPLIALSGSVGGLAPVNGTTFDTSGYVALKTGSVCDAYGHRIDSIKFWYDEASKLPFDTLLMKSYFRSLKTEHTRHFTDSTSSRSDTLILSNASVSPSRQQIISNSNVVIDGSIENKTIIASGKLIVGSNAYVRHCYFMSNGIAINGGTTENCRFFSPSAIKINDGSHNSQFFSHDTIIIGGSVKTGPFSLWIVNFTREKMSTIIFKKNKNVCGSAICFCEKGDESNGIVTILLEDSTNFTGYLITDNAISMKNVVITGHVRALSIWVEKDSKGYINFLFGTSMLHEKQPLVFPLLQSSPERILFFESGKSVQCY